MFGLATILGITKNLSPETFDNALESEELDLHFSDYEMFFNELESENSPLNKVLVVVDGYHTTRVGYHLFH